MKLEEKRKTLLSQHMAVQFHHILFKTLWHALVIYKHANKVEYCMNCWKKEGEVKRYS